MTYPTLEQILTGIDNAVADFEATAPRVRSETEKKVLLSAANGLRALRPRIAEEVPANLQAFHGTLEGMQADAVKLQEEIAVQQARLADVRAAAAAKAAEPKVPVSVPQPPAPPPIDPQLGARLRQELLTRVAPGDTAPPPTAPGKDIWQDWE